MNISKLTISDVAIRQDTDGRYSLNDLHRAAGGENRHRPSLWSENQQTKDLISEFESEAGIPALVSRHGGSTSGTYVCRELVYSYAMWISPSFNLKVIRAYDAQVTGQQMPIDSAITATKLFRPCFQIARLIGCDKNAAAISANQAVHKLTGQNVLALLGQVHLESERQELFFTPSELGARPGVTGKTGTAAGREFNLLLQTAGLHDRIGNVWVPSPAAEGYCRILDTGKKHMNGTPVQQIKWSERVLDLFRKVA